MLRILFLFIVFTSIAINTVSADDTGVLTLDCTIMAGFETSDPRKNEQLYYVDFDRQKVNGYDAQIGADEIRWRMGKFFAVINRRTGYFGGGDDTNPSLVKGSCAKAPDKKF